MLFQNKILHIFFRSQAKIWYRPFLNSFNKLKAVIHPLYIKTLLGFWSISVSQRPLLLLCKFTTLLTAPNLARDKSTSREGSSLVRVRSSVRVQNVNTDSELELEQAWGADVP